jgi:hypothetical protein
MLGLHHITLAFDAFARDHPEDIDVSEEENKEKLNKILKEEVS